MALPTVATVACDILVVGGGKSGCGAAFESKYWGEENKWKLIPNDRGCSFTAGRKRTDSNGGQFTLKFR